MTMGGEILAITAGMPERRLAPGEVLFHEGARGDAVVAVLVEGVLGLEAHGASLPELAAPGSFVGEMGALLGTARSATVVARAPTTVRIIGDPNAFFATHPALALELARQLAGRLHRLVAYLGDLRSQYADHDGHLGMVDSVLARLASRPPVDIEPGSDRSPDY
jgi:CRP-like cAMP-binding protein